MATNTLARQASLAPSYKTTDNIDATTPRSSSSSLNPPDAELGLPPYSAANPEEAAAAATTGFTPTLSLQIETPGKPWLSLPLPPRPDPIPIYLRSDILNPNVTPSSEPTFVSHRPKRSSGSSYITTSAHPSHNDLDEHTPVSTTTYRFGPGRNAIVRLFDTSAPIKPFNISTSDKKDDEADAAAQDAAAWDAFELEPRGLLTRAVRFKTRLGTFEWRYASRKERKALSAASAVGSASGFRTAENLGEVDSLLVLDRIVRIFGAQNAAGSSKKDKDGEEIRTPVARLVRGKATRSAGSGASTAGNGGLLQIDMGRRGGGVWGVVQGEEEDGVDLKKESGTETELEMARVLVVTTAVSMLKKEVDRRRAHQIAIMAGAAGGGGP